MKNLQKEKIINHDVNVINFDSLLKEVKKLSISNMGHYICITAVHSIIEAYNNKKFAKIVNSADLTLADGRPVFWALKLLNHKDIGHFPGYRVTRIICKYASENKLKVGFYGGKPETLKKCIKNLKDEFKDLETGYLYSPPYRDLNGEEKKSVINNINKSEIKFLFVCLGCPKQEYWMEEHKSSINCTKIGIGAAIDFIAGEKYLPPIWVQRMGLFWLTRLILEPRRLFWRYFSTKFKFICLFSKKYLKKKINE